MAPNLVKSASLVSLDLSHHCIDLSSTAPSRSRAQSVIEYPPLTSVSASSVPNDNDNDIGLYLDNDSFFGSKPTLRRTPSMLYQIIVEDEAKRAVSCELIETNLIADSNAAARKQNNDDQQVNVNDVQAEHESYWDMPTETDVVDNDAVFSTGQVERLLVEDALRRTQDADKGTTAFVSGHPNNAFWDWPSEPVLESEKRDNLIRSIVMEEAIRQQLSISHITDVEVSNKDKNTNKSVPQVEATQEVQVSTDYWSWDVDAESKEEEKTADDDIIAPHVNDASHPNHAYWDFPSNTRGPEEIKAHLIDSILRDERIRNLLSSAVVAEREVNFHRTKQSNNQKNKYVPASKSMLASVPADYWDLNSEEGFLSLVASEKQQMINRILREEKQRFILSMENIEQNIKEQRQTQQQQQSQQVNNSPITTSYWDW